METLTFNYGETPRDVLIERAVRTRNGEALGPVDPATNWLANIEPGDLLTVLDALTAAQYVGVTLDYSRPAPADLRRDILAALGIVES